MEGLDIIPGEGKGFKNGFGIVLIVGVDTTEPTPEFLGCKKGLFEFVFTLWREGAGEVE